MWYAMTWFYVWSCSCGSSLVPLQVFSPVQILLIMQATGIAQFFLSLIFLFFLFWNLKICFYQFPLFFSVFFFCSSFYFLFFFLFLVLFLPSFFIHIIFLSPLLFTFKICYPFFSLFLLCFVCFSLICSITI